MKTFALIRGMSTDFEDGRLFADSTSDSTGSYDGSCHCGQIKWTVTLDNPQHVLCHCDTCKKLGGGPFSCNQIVSQDDLRIRMGSPRTYTYTGASGGSNRWVTVFQTKLTRSRETGTMLPLRELHLAYLPSADDCAGEDHCQDNAAGRREQDGCRR